MKIIKKKSRLFRLKRFWISIIGSVISGVILILLTPTINSFITKKPEPTLITSLGQKNDTFLTQYRFDINDITELQKRIKAINIELESDNKYINEDLLKNFIYAMNGDYPLALDKDSFTRVMSIFINFNSKVVSILENNETYRDDYTPINSLADIFCDLQDYDFVSYWQDKYNTLCQEIYNNASSDKTIEKLDQFCILMHQTFIGKEPIRLSSTKTISIYKVSDEAIFFASVCIAGMTDTMILRNEGRKETTIIYESEVDIHTLSEEIYNFKNQITEKIFNKLP